MNCTCGVSTIAAMQGTHSESCPAFSNPYKVPLRCLQCNTLHYFKLDSPEANGIFNVFCRDKDCEDRYAARL
jgi:hypothetical protein